MILVRGFDIDAISDQLLIACRDNGENRVKYIIANALIMDTRPQFQPYSEIEQSVKFRQAHQKHLLEKPNLKWRFILNETILHRPIGHLPQWHEQIHHLIQVAQRTNVTLQILPFSTGVHPVMGSAFTLLRFNSEPSLNTVYLENDRNGHHFKSVNEIKRYTTIFNQLSEMASLPKDTLGELAKVAMNL